MDEGSIKIAFAISGDEELARQFLTLGSRVRAVATREMAAIARDLADRIAARAPVASGQLRANIDPTHVGIDAKAGQPDTLVVRVRPWGHRGETAAGRKDGNYAIALFNERGLPAKKFWVRGHVVGETVLAPRGKRRQRTVKNWAGGHWRDRGAIPARPFFQPTVEGMRAEMLSRLESALLGALKSEAA